LLNGNLKERYDKNGNKWSYVYDNNNRLLHTYDPEGGITSYNYDALGRTTKTITMLNGTELAVTQSLYD